MKTLLALLGGAALGATLVYIMFTRQLVVLASGNGNERLISIDRFTGEAQEVFIATFDLNRATEAEYARDQVASEAFMAARQLEKLAPPQDGTDSTSPWVELPQEEINKLQIQFRNSQGRYRASWHNHFEKRIRIETIRSESPAAEGREALDRIYKVGWETPALQDNSQSLNANLSEYPEGTIKFTPVKVFVHRSKE